jgi:hypothetical protein
MSSGAIYWWNASTFSGSVDIVYPRGVGRPRVEAVRAHGVAQVGQDAHGDARPGGAQQDEARGFVLRVVAQRLCGIKLARQRARAGGAPALQTQARE